MVKKIQYVRIHINANGLNSAANIELFKRKPMCYINIKQKTPEVKSINREKGHDRIKHSPQQTFYTGKNLKSGLKQKVLYSR